MRKCVSEKKRVKRTQVERKGTSNRWREMQETR